MADILLTHSYLLRFDPKEYQAMMPYPPLGTLYAAASVRRQGFSVALFDSMLATREEDLQPSLALHRPRIVVIYDDDFNYLTKMCLSRMRQAAFTMSALAREAGCTVIIHGSDAVDHLEEYFAHGADYVLCGEGERTLVELLTCLRDGTPSLDEIAGLAFVRDASVVRTPRREVLRTLDDLPFPAWDLVDIERYRMVWRQRHGYFSVNMVTTRGCPFHCNWCAKPIYGQVYNSRSPANVAEEMLWLKQTIRPDHLWFCDDIFGLKPGWIAAFSEEVAKRAAQIPFKCLARVDLLLRDNAIAPLKQAGCATVWVGAESGSQSVLDAMEKGTTVDQIREATRRLKAAGIRVGFFLQYGYPGETREDIDRTLAMVQECLPDEIGVSVSYPLPGTSFYERVRTQLGDKQNWVDSQDLALMFSGTFVPDFYRVLHRYTHKSFRIWRGQGVLRRMMRTPMHVGPRPLRSLAAMAYDALTIGRERVRLNRLAAAPAGRLQTGTSPRQSDRSSGGA
jgi:anaerobic magnesium-protoporphyrin IX monomethyl ester cyclase